MPASLSGLRIETRRLVNYHQAAFFINKSNRLLLANISGVPDYEKNAPFVKWLKKLLTKILTNKQREEQLVFSEQEIPEK